MTPSVTLAQSPWRRARWLVLSPHPDDETIGTGALIADAGAQGRLSAIVYLTDGTGSHPAGTRGLASARRREAGLAIRRLTKATPRMAWLGWRDAHPHPPGTSGFDSSAGRLAALLCAYRVDALAVTSRADEHCDHRAAYRLAAAAIERSRRPIGLFEFAVWSKPPLAVPFATRPMPAGLRRHALRAHRSQFGPSMGEGFRLPRDMQRMPERDLLYLSKRR